MANVIPEALKTKQVVRTLTVTVYDDNSMEIKAPTDHLLAIKTLTDAIQGIITQEHIKVRKEGQRIVRPALLIGGN